MPLLLLLTTSLDSSAPQLVLREKQTTISNKGSFCTLWAGRVRVMQTRNTNEHVRIKQGLDAKGITAYGVIVGPDSRLGGNRRLEAWWKVRRSIL